MKKTIIKSIKNERRYLVRAQQEAVCWVQRRGLPSDFKDLQMAKENCNLFSACFGHV
jgi:hypothetical protein